MKEELIKKIQDIVLEKLSGIYGEIDKAMDILSDLEKQISVKTPELANIISTSEITLSTISEAEKKLDKRTLDVLKKEEEINIEKERLSNLKNVLNDEIKVGKDKLFEIQRDINVLAEQRNEQTLRFQIENDTRIKELRLELEKRIPELSKKEEELKSKKNDLDIIEKRWKNLYESKGAGFKI